jgi:superfamily II DNA or RNA helicase
VGAATGEMPPEKEVAVAEPVDVVLKNRTALLVRPYPYEAIVDHLKFRVDGFEFMQSKYPGWDGYIKLLKNDTMGAGLFLAMREKIERAASVSFRVEDRRRPPELKPTLDLVFNTPSTRTYQWDCVKKMIEASCTGGLVLSATGTGKTFIAAMYMKMLVGNAVFVVDELQLLKQAQAELSNVLGEPVGQVGKSVFDPKRVTVATIQTMHLHRRDLKFAPWAKSLQCIFLDEVHLALNRRNFETVNAIKPPVVFGLTATLELRKRRVALQAFNTCGPVIFEFPLEQGVKEGFLSPGVVVFMDHVNHFEKTNTRWYFNKGKSAKEYAAAIVENKNRLDLVCRIVREAVRRDKYVIVLVERLKHILSLTKALGDVPHGIACGLVKVDSRINAGKNFEKGNIRLIIANKVFKKGINLKRVDVIIDAAAMRNKNDAVQKYGRGVRMCEGKNGLIYFDICDKTPVGAKKHRFEAAAEERRAALKSRGLVTCRAHETMDMKHVFDRAEEELAKVVAAVPQKESVA